MPDWFSKFVQEWPVISGAPVSFTAAVIVTIVIVWAIVNWSYSTVLSSKNAQIELLQGRISDYQDKLKGATPDQAADELKRLRAELDAIKNPPRQENGVYQNGKLIGAAVNPSVDIQNKMVRFGAVTVAGQIDEASIIEFRNLVLIYRGVDGGVSRAAFGLDVKTTYVQPRFEIVGNR